MVTSFRECTVILVEAFMSASPENDSTLLSIYRFPSKYAERLAGAGKAV